MLFLKNKFVKLLIILFSSIFICLENKFSIYAQNKELFLNTPLKRQWIYKEGVLFNPYYLLISNNKIFVIDYQAEKPILVFNTKGQFLSYIGEWGQGPGEMQRGLKFAGFYHDKLLIYDFDNQRISVFDITTRDFITSFKIFSALSVRVVNNLLVIKSKFSKSFAVGVQINKNFTIQSKPDSIFYGEYKSIPELLPCKRNYLLKQGPICTDNKGNIYFALERSSLIFGFSSNGSLIFKTSKPYDIAVPDFVTYNPEYKLTSPPLNKYPETNIAISVDDYYIYTVYSGLLIRNMKEYLTRGNEVDQGRILNIYKKTTGKYKYSLRLPIAVRDLYVTNNAIYVISVDPDIALLKFDKPNELRKK